MNDSPYRAPKPVPPDPYVVTWDVLRRWDRLRRWTLIPAYLAWLCLFLAMRGSGSMVPSLFFLGVTVANLAFNMRRDRRIMACPCPRCTKRFFDGKIWWSLGRTTCQNCGIRFGTPKSACRDDFVRVDASTPTVRIADSTAGDEAVEADGLPEPEQEPLRSARGKR